MKNLFINKHLLFTAALLCFLPSLFSQNIPRPNIFAPKATGVEVNSYNGNPIYRIYVFSLPTRGMDVELTLSWNGTHSGADWGYGYGWTHTYNQQYWLDSTTMALLRADGRTDRFTSNGNSYTAPKGIFDTWEEYQSGKFRLTTKYGEKYFFDDSNHKKLTKIEDRNGNTITLEYNGGKLSKITDPTRQRFLELTWSGNHCTAITDKFDPAAPRTFQLHYDGGDLTKTTNPANGEVWYYYKQHLLTNIADENSNESAIKYNEGGAATQVASCLTRQTITYNIASRRTYVGELVEGVNQITTYEYDTLGRNTTRHGNCCGYNVAYTYDDDLNVVTVTDGNGYLWQYQHDGNGNVLKEIAPNGDSEEFTYHPVFNLITSHKDKMGFTTTYVYDNNGNLLEVHKPLGVNEFYTYDEFGNNLTFKDGNGHITTYNYNTNGDLISMVYPTQPITTISLEYDERGNRISEADGNQHKTTYSYDVLNRLLKEIAPAPFLYVTEHAYDPRGNRLFNVNAKGDTTFYKYDGLDRLVEVKAPMNLVTRHAYDSRSNLIRTTSPDGSITQYAYNERNQLVKAIDPLQQATLYDYDGNGNQTAMTDPNGHTTSYTFDELDRLVGMEDALGNVTEYEYDKNDNLIKVTDANGIETTYEFDALNRQVLMRDAIGGETHYEYDFNDNLKKITDANGNPTEYKYDPMNRVIEEKFADNTTKTYEYDGTGNVISRKDNAGIFTEYIYDELNRLIKRNYPGNNDDEFRYDPIGQMTEAKNQYATVNFTHDAAGRITSEELNGHTTHYQYNTPARKRILTYPSGRIVEEFFDKRSQLVLVKADGANVASFTYDPAGRMNSKAFSNGTKAVYTHDAANRTTSLKHEKAGVSFVHFTYAFDAVGNKQYERKLHHPTHSDKYEYTDLYQLKRFRVGMVDVNGSLSNLVTQTEYHYDLLGNRNFVNTDGTTQSYTANEMNEYTQIITGTETALPTHDDNGNLSWDGAYNLGYDHENRLISVDGGATAIYQYDALGRRFRKKTSDTVTNYYYDDFREIEERDGSDNVTATYVFGTWIDDVLEMKRGGDVYFYHANPLGSVSALTDAAGTMVERYEYGGYGEVQFLDAGFGRLNGSGVGNGILFTGRSWDEECSAYYFRKRHLTTIFGAFFQRDPLGYIEGKNLYRPYFIPHSIDPTGTASLTKGECERRIQSYKNRIEHVLKGCTIPKFQCDCKCPLDKGGKFDRGKNELTMCVIDFNYPPNNFEEILKHELQHAYDYCQNPYENDCKSKACREIKAYNHNCSEKGIFRQPNETLQDCVIRKAVSSMGTCKNAETLVQTMYSQCISMSLINF
ncbi:MAG: DUF6531 domain-containing protein [Saprospiraceae bacterium]